MRRAFLRPAAKPGRLEGGERAGGEPAGEQGRVVDGDRAAPGRAAGGRRDRPDAPAGSGPFPYEGLGQRGDPDQRLPRQVLREVDDVRAQVAERPGAGRLPAQPPGERELRVDQPVLKVGHPHVPQGAEPALGDHAAGVARWRAPGGS